MIISNTCEKPFDFAGPPVSSGVLPESFQRLLESCWQRHVPFEMMNVQDLRKHFNGDSGLGHQMMPEIRLHHVSKDARLLIEALNNVTRDFELLRKLIPDRRADFDWREPTVRRQPINQNTHHKVASGSFNLSHKLREARGNHQEFIK